MSYQVGQYPATPEQANAIRLAETGDSLKIEAGAGAGKSTTLTAIAQYCPGSTLYIAYNKSVAMEAAKLFPKHVKCVTAHSLAYQAVGKLYRERLGKPITARQIIAWLDITETVFPMPLETWAFLIMETIRNYTYSADSGIVGRHAPDPAAELLPDRSMLPLYRSRLANDARRLWSGIMDPRGELPVSHDAYLKRWAESRPTLPAERILYDESQDANAPMMSAVQRQSAQQIWVGDQYQTIYRWRGAVNAMRTIETTHATQITQSFRFGPPIAAVANAVLERWLGADFRIRGFERVKSQVMLDTPVRKPDAILCRTNATAVETLVKLVEAGEKPRMMGDLAGMLRLLKGIGALLAGRQAFAPALAPFRSFAELREHVDSGLGGELGTLVGLMYQRKLGDLIKLLEAAKSCSKPTITICTAHKSKGLQWPVVQLANDFAFPTPEEPFEEEEANLLYVAVTRAMTTLDISQCDAAQQVLSDDRAAA